MTVPANVSIGSGVNEMLLDGWLTSFDLGSPSVREVARDVPRSDGTIDLTSHTGARSVGMGLRFDDQSELMRFMSFGHPSIRTTLRVGSLGPWPAVSAHVRPDGFFPRVSRQEHLLGVAAVMANFVVPAGVFSAVSTPGSPVTARPGSTGEEPGIVLPEELPWAMPPAPIVGAVTALSAGTAPSKPTIVIHGPATNPAVFSAPYGYVTKLGMSIASGQFVVLDHTARTAQLNGVPGGANSVHHLIDWAVSTWWPIHVGEQQITMTATAYAAPDARAVVTWDDSYL